MKRINKLFFYILLFVFSITNVYAECSTEDMNKIRNEAVQVKASYEKTVRIMNSGEYVPPDGTPDDAELSITQTYFKIYINNITENLYVVVHNDTTDSTQTFTYADSDNGTVTFDWYRIVSKIDYTITVYSSSNTNCPDTKLYVINLTTPRYNYYSSDKVCLNASDFYLCQEYVTVDDVDYATLQKKVEAYLAGKVDNNGEEIETPGDVIETNFWDENKTIIIIGIVAIVIIGIGTILIIKKRGKKKNEDTTF